MDKMIFTLQMRILATTGLKIRSSRALHIRRSRVRGCTGTVGSSVDGSYWGVQVYGSTQPLQTTDAPCNLALVPAHHRLAQETWPTDNNALSWRKVEFRFNTYQHSLRYLTITGLRNAACGRYFFIDNVHVEEECCADYMLYQNTFGMPPLTQRKDYIWAGYDVGCQWRLPGPAIVQSNQNVTFIAAAPQTFNGFSTEPGAVFDMHPGGCELIQPVQDNYEIELLGYDQGAFFDCTNSPPNNAKFTSRNATHYWVQIFDNWGGKVYDKFDAIHEQGTLYLDGYGMYTCDQQEVYTVELILYNCVSAATRIYGYSLTYFYLEDCFPYNFCDCPFADCKTGKTEMDKVASKTIIVYPNPTANEAYIKVNEDFGSNNTIVIYNQLGQEVHRQENVSLSRASQPHKISLGDLSAGIYSLSIRTSLHNYTQKLIIQK